MKPVRLKDVRANTARLHGQVLAYLARLCGVISKQDGPGLAARASELEPFILAAGDLVRRFIFALACLKLRHAGLTHAANALVQANQQAGHALPDDFFLRVGSVAAPEDIPVQLNRILSDFENAEALSDFIACLWGFWLAPYAMTTGDRHGPHKFHATLLEPSRRRSAARLPFHTTHPGGHRPAGQKSVLRYPGLSPPPWPPPVAAHPHVPAL